MINLTIFKTEFRLNLKLVLIWTAIFAILIIINLSAFDLIKDQQASIDAIAKSLPPEFLQAFSVNKDSFSTVEGYFSGKNVSLYLLAFSVLAVYLGAQSIGREIHNRTITFLATKPLSRMEIYLSKTVTSISLLLLADVITCLASFAASRLLTTDHSASLRFFAALFFMSWLMQILFLGVGQILGIWFNETQGFLLGIGAVFVSWIVDIISVLPGVPAAVKYISSFHYVSADYIHITHQIRVPHVLALLVMGTTALAIAAWSFHRRDFEA